MNKKTLLKILGVVFAAAFFATLWWGSWFLRGGVDGPNNWAIIPVFLQGTITFAAAAWCFIFGSE